MKKEILTRITSSNKCYYSLLPILKKRNISRATKMRTYNTIIRPIVLYASEAWTLTKELEAKLMVFENNILRKIYGPIMILR